MDQCTRPNRFSAKNDVPELISCLRNSGNAPMRMDRFVRYTDEPETSWFVRALSDMGGVGLVRVRGIG